MLPHAECSGPSFTLPRRLYKGVRVEEERSALLRSVTQFPQPPHAIFLSDNPLGNKTIYSLFRVLDSETLRFLHLARTGCDDGVLYALGTFLSPTSPLASLDITGNWITRYGLWDIAPVLANLHSLQILSISHLSTQDADIARFLDILFPSASSSMYLTGGMGIRRLDVACSGVGLASVQSISKVIRKNNCPIRSLDLGGIGRIPWESFHANLVSALAINTSLRFLDLRGFMLDGIFKKCLFTGLRLNRHLEALYITVSKEDGFGHSRGPMEALEAEMNSNRETPLAHLYVGVEYPEDEVLMVSMDEKRTWVRKRQRILRHVWSIARILLAPGNSSSFPGIMELPPEIREVIVAYVGIADGLSGQVIHRVCVDAMARPYRGLDLTGEDRDWLLDRLGYRIV
ncbi:hypothetical protein BJ684DRAFT_14470 [Piptocephalis cylindrospora]|uniref:RNI-like protein n=1 Tax=Piptocephalis cylindrospora TaxID=1907219 RepID=A0A4P9Y877_9FUNG|nr:hypothetical protein BJ684DRAFT_14470 [Piptocephalis cylindrospora]|eukprot:RKP15273.1 hypothetical protein BJ684DRAFT_14470 [Piptocephalis cylindrospora]